MTCIIGSKCKDGVVLVADRKVICSTNSVESREKIFMDFTPFVVASSGYTMSFDNFRREAKDLAIRSRVFRIPGESFFSAIPYDPTAFSGVAINTISPSWPHPVIPLTNYLDGLKSIVKRYKTEVNSDPTYEFDIIVASRAEDTGLAYLSYIDENGMIDDKETWKRYIVIGSYETRVATEFLIKPVWNHDMMMDQFAELAYFIIKYVDRFKTDVTVGLEDQRPLVWFIPNIGTPAKAPDTYIDSLDSKTNQMLDNYSRDGIRLLLTYSS
jgi:hypothetical protein